MEIEGINQEFAALAARFRASQPAVHPAPAAFRANLRARLLDQYMAPTARSIRSWAWIALATLAIAIASAYVLFGSPWGVRPVSAAEVLQKANVVSLWQGEGAVLYDRMSIDLYTGLVDQTNVIGEFWQAAQGNQFRFQLRSAQGGLFYFAQRDGERIWRSYHDQPIGAEVTPWIYQMTVDQYRAFNFSGAEDPLQIPALGTTSGLGWLALDRRLAEDSQPCRELFCLLGLAGGEWQCSVDSCTLVENGRPTHEAVLSADNGLKDGYLIEIREIPETGVRQVVQIDAQTYALIEVDGYRGDQRVSRLKLLEHKAMKMDELSSANFFSTVPDGVSVADFGISDPSEPANRVWVIAVSPPPGTYLAQPTDLHVTLGYELATREEALLQVMLWPDFAWPGGSTESQEQMVRAGVGVVDVRLAVEPDSLPQGRWGLKVILGYLSDDKELKTLSGMEWGEYQWCVGCGDGDAPAP